MKQIKDLLKDGKDTIDAEKLFDQDGLIDNEALELLQREKPLLPSVSENRVKKLSVIEHRDRYKVFPDRLPTKGLLPMPQDEHELIGFFDNKMNLYLTIANAYNTLMQKLEALQQRVEQLEKKGK